MYSFMNYTFESKSKNKDFIARVEKDLNGKFENGKLVNDTDDINFRMDLLWNKLEGFVKDFPNEEFNIEGVYDTSSAAGELLDFYIGYENGYLDGKCSGWYVEEDKCLYDSYEESFDESDNPPITKEEFDKWEDGDLYFSLDSGDGEWVKQVDKIYNIKDFFGL